MAIAISSFVLASSAPWVSALWAMAENAFITSGAPPRRFLSSALQPFVSSGQFFVSMIKFSLPPAKAGDAGQATHAGAAVLTKHIYIS